MGLFPGRVEESGRGCQTGRKEVTVLCSTEEERKLKARNAALEQWSQTEAPVSSIGPPET